MGRPLYGYVMDGYWQDIGNLDQFRQANFDALDEKVHLDVPGIRIRGNVWLGEGVEVGDLEQIEGPAFIGNYCRIARRRDGGRVLGALEQRHAARAHADDALGDRRVDPHRAQLTDRGRRSSAAPATSAPTSASTRASRSATR